jgi:hypothetical protein
MELAQALQFSYTSVAQEIVCATDAIWVSDHVFIPQDAGHAGRILRWAGVSWGRSGVDAKSLQPWVCPTSIVGL